MVNEVFDVLINILCPTYESASVCRDFVNAPSHQVLAPVGPLLYFLFFPSVFIILFIYILSNSILKGGGLTQGLRFLIAVSVYAYIIISGWYYIFLPLSEIWFVIIIILGFLYLIIRHFGGEGSGKMPAISSKAIPLYVTKKAKKFGGKIGLEKAIEDRLNNLRGVLEQLEKPSEGTDVGNLIRSYWTIRADTEKLIDLLEAQAGYLDESVTKKYWNEINKLSKRFEHQKRKYVS